MNININIGWLILLIISNLVFLWIILNLIGSISFTKKNKFRRLKQKQDLKLKLIDLPFRHELIHELTECIRLVKKAKKRLVVFLIGIDSFNVINERLGIEVGDLLLQQVAERLKQNLQQQSLIIAYMGGDEYALINTVAENNGNKEFGQYAENLQALLSKPYQINTHEINIKVSIGITIYPEHAETAEKLIKFASMAIAAAKKTGKNAYSFYTTELSKQTADSFVLSEALYHAIERKELRLVYQPKIAVATGEVVSAEALVRWHHPGKGLISPEIFIPLAEEIGMITAIGDWILFQAGNDLKKLHQEGIDQLSMAVNLSAAQFDKGDVVGLIANVLYETKLEPRFFEVELTESLVMHNPVKSLLMLRVLKSMGVKIAIDDFGTGHSSLSYLKNLPIDLIKIDQSFVKGMAKDPNNQAIVSTIIGMAKKLNLKVVAEGVENIDEVALLTAEGCDYFQGYYYSKPLGYAEFKQYCAQHKKHNSI